MSLLLYKTSRKDNTVICLLRYTLKGEPRLEVSLAFRRVLVPVNAHALHRSVLRVVLDLVQAVLQRRVAHLVSVRLPLVLDQNQHKGDAEGSG